MDELMLLLMIDAVILIFLIVGMLLTQDRSFVGAGFVMFLNILLIARIVGG